MIRFDDVTMRHDSEGEPALSHVDLEIARGELVVLVGASGSGKSTLLRLVTRELRTGEGAVLVAGHDLGRLPERRVPELRRRIGTVFQDFRLLEDRTVAQNVAFVLQVLGRRRHQIAQQVPEALELVGLTGKEGRLPHQLSGGEQQRAAIARAVVTRPQVVLADEPTGNLDPATGAEIVRVLQRVHRRGATVVVATHDEAVVEQVGRRVVELSGGRVVRDVDPVRAPAVRARREVAV